MSKIVIIEDDKIIARIYETKFRAEGHQVSVASDGASGLEVVKSTSPDLVLVDLMLPHMSGVEVIKGLRRDKRFVNLPIVAYSGADDELLSEARDANPTALLSKNELSPKEIYGHINAVLEANRTWVKTDPFSGEVQTAPETPFQWERVLIVEDDPIIAMIVRDIVEKAGYQAVLIDDGAEAYRTLTEDSNFAAAIFDIELPKIKGTDLMRFMRSEKRLQRIPIMAMTAADSIRIQLDSHEAGAALFVPKPFERPTFETMFLMLTGKNKKSEGFTA